MRILVQKFGGTSVATPQARACVYQKILAARDEGFAVVAVLSAMGRKGEPYATDTLLEVFSHGSALPNSREQDMIYSCGEIVSGCVAANELRMRGIASVLLTGGQAGIVTDRHFSDAEIQTIHTESILHWLEKNYVVLVTGGQGASPEGDFTSIGRGGSDTTACAIGYYLQAEVRIYTDVDGIYTADPRVVHNARKIPQISYGQCRYLAELGAKVIHPRAVAFTQRGKKNGLSLRSTFSEDVGTAIGNYSEQTIGITATRGQRCFQIPAADYERIEKRLEEKCVSPLFLCEQDDMVCGCLSEEQWEKAGLHVDSRVRDVIFAVGPDVKNRICRWPNREITEQDIWIKGEDCAAVLVEPQNYEELINRLHDELCIGG